MKTFDEFLNERQVQEIKYQAEQSKKAIVESLNADLRKRQKLLDLTKFSDRKIKLK